MPKPAWGLQDYVDWYGYRVLRYTPISWVSAFGAGAGRIFAAYASYENAPWWGGVLETLATITGERNSERLRELRKTSIQNIARTRFEFAILERLLKSRRLRVHGAHNLDGRSAPTVFVGAHLGNWELIAHGLLRQGVSFAAVYDPPILPSHHRIAVETRERVIAHLPGTRLLKASRATGRELVRAVDGGENVLIYIDEHKADLVWAPAFGRKLPDTGNRMLAARLALRVGGDVIPIRTRRGANATFDVFIEPPLRIDPTGDKHRDALALGNLIADTIEPWVKEDIDQWFWLPYLALGRLFPRAVDQDPGAAGA